MPSDTYNVRFFDEEGYADLRKVSHFVLQIMFDTGKPPTSLWG